VISSLWSWLSHTASPQSALWSTVLTGFLVWRVSRGGRISRMILIIISGVSHVVVALDVARLWDRAVMAAAIICTAQIALLVSPPVYGRTGPTAQRLRAVGPGEHVGPVSCLAVDDGPDWRVGLRHRLQLQFAIS